MKPMNKKLTALVLSGTLLCSLSAQAFALTLPADTANQSDTAVTVKQNTQKIQTVLYSGTVKEIVRENGKITRLLLQGKDANDQTVAVITGETLWLDGGKSSAAAPADLAEGEAVFLVHSPISTRSLPPQTQAFAIVRHTAMDGQDVEATSSAYNSVVYTGTLKEIARSTDGAGQLVQLTLENEKGEYVMNLSKDTLWIEGEKIDTTAGMDLKVGEKLCVVHSTASTRSLPPQSAAYAVIRAFDPAGQDTSDPGDPNGGLEAPGLPNSVLYYGSIKDITKNEAGTITQLWLESEAYGEYVMNLSYDTAWIDSGKGTVSDPADLKVGERVYIHHSPIATLSLPPQSYGYAVVRNIPMDVSCAMYHEIEALQKNSDGSVTVTTDNGGLHLTIEKDAAVSSYDSGKTVTLADLKAGDKIMAWYGMVAESYPAQAGTKQVMLLNTPGSVAMTRGSFAAMLYEKTGGEPVKYAMSYKDVNETTANVEAIRWASSKGLLSGYQDGTFGPDKQLSREQLVTVLWRYLDSVPAKDATVLDQYKDAGTIAAYARPAMAWAQEAGMLTGDKNGSVNPKGQVTRFEAENMLQSVNDLLSAEKK